MPEPRVLPTTSSGGSCLVPLTVECRVSSVLDMKLTDAQIEALESAVAAVQEANAALKEAKANREQLLRELGAEGHSYRTLAQYSGVSYQRVAQLLGVKDDRLHVGQTIEAYCPTCEAEPGARCVGATGRFHGERYTRRQAIHDGELDDVREGEPTYGES